MTARHDMIEAARAALVKNWPGEQHYYKVEVVLQEVEPLIRADERQKVLAEYGLEEQP